MPSSVSLIGSIHFLASKEYMEWWALVFGFGWSLVGRAFLVEKGAKDKEGVECSFLYKQKNIWRDGV